MSHEPSGVGLARAPEGRAPVVESRRVFGPRRAVVRCFEGVRVLDRTPGWIERLFRGGGTHVTGEALLDRTELGHVLLGLAERDLVLPAGQRRPAELRQIVLPQADEANIVRARRFVEDQVPAGRTGKAL